VKKINTEVTVQSSKSGVGLHKNLEKKAKWISATNSCNSTGIRKIELFYIGSSQYFVSQYNS